MFCYFPSIQTDLNSGDMSQGQNLVPTTRLFMKIKRSHDGTSPRDVSLQHVPSCVPTFKRPLSRFPGDNRITDALFRPVLSTERTRYHMRIRNEYTDQGIWQSRLSCTSLHVHRSRSISAWKGMAWCIRAQHFGQTHPFLCEMRERTLLASQGEGPGLTKVGGSADEAWMPNQ